MMVRRYQDAIRTLSNILLFIQRTKQHFQSRTYLYDQVRHSPYLPLRSGDAFNSFLQSVEPAKTLSLLKRKITIGYFGFV